MAFRDPSRALGVDRKTFLLSAEKETIEAAAHPDMHMGRTCFLNVQKDDDIVAFDVESERPMVQDVGKGELGPTFERIGRHGIESLAHVVVDDMFE